jgi:hypothetical protein
VLTTDANPPSASRRCGTSTPLTIGPARALAVETSTLEHTLSDLVNQALRPDLGGDPAFSAFAFDPASGTVFFRLLTPLRRPTSRLPLGTKNGTVGA